MTAFRRRASFAFSLFIAAAAATGALAAPVAERTRAAVLQSLTACRGIAEAAERLACYDKAAASLEQAEAKGEVVVVDREQAQAVRRQAFGFALPSLALLGGGADDGSADEVTAKAAAVRRGPSGKWIVQLEDGAVWSQTDTMELPRDPKAGMAVTIRKAALGGFMLSAGGQRSFRARRER